MVFNAKKMQRAAGRTPFAGAGQGMQEAEYSAPLERRQYALPGVTQAPGFAGGPDFTLWAVRGAPHCAPLIQAYCGKRRPPRTGGGRLSAAGGFRVPAGRRCRDEKPAGRATGGGFGWLLSRACGRFCAGQGARRLCRHASRTSGYRLHTARMGLSKSSLSTVTPMVTSGACPCVWLFVPLTHVSSTGSRWSGWEKPYWMTE